MTTLHKAVQMALDALDAITDDVDGTGLNTMPSFDKALDAIAALREALAAPEPEPEPVAWYYVEDPWGANEWHFMTDSPESQECDPRDWTPLYATPPAAPAPAGWVMAPREPTPEMLAVVRNGPMHETWTEGYCAMIAASPAAPAAPVVPLTEGRITAIANELAFGGGHCNVYELARAIEAAHGITGGKP